MGRDVRQMATSTWNALWRPIPTGACLSVLATGPRVWVGYHPGPTTLGGVSEMGREHHASRVIPELSPP